MQKKYNRLKNIKIIKKRRKKGKRSKKGKFHRTPKAQHRDRGL